jgi:hypothetical protein
VAVVPIGTIAGLQVHPHPTNGSEQA